MKPILITLGCGILLGGITLGIKSEKTTYHAEPVEVIEEVIVEEVDVIDKAQEELDRINAELDVKEQELLEAREQIDLELERLRETRSSF